MNVWILGAGRFGALAVRRLLSTRQEPGAPVDITVIDTDRARLSDLPEGVRTGRAHFAEYLVRRLGKGMDPDAIVPAVPVHAAREWLAESLSPWARLCPLPVPEALAMPEWHPMHGPDGALYLTRADFLCPDDCPEPRGRCTVTGRPRGENLFDVLAKTALEEVETVVVRSRQLAPGVGGYAPAALYDARARILKAPGPVLLATACRCHGVVHAFLIEKTPCGPERSGSNPLEAA